MGLSHQNTNEVEHKVTTGGVYYLKIIQQDIMKQRVQVCVIDNMEGVVRHALYSKILCPQHSKYRSFT